MKQGTTSINIIVIAFLIIILDFAYLIWINNRLEKLEEAEQAFRTWNTDVVNWIKENSEPSNYLICKVETDTNVAFIKLEHGENITNFELAKRLNKLNISIFDVPAELNCTMPHFLKGTNISTERFFK